jgi:hypothetical protein
MIRRLLVLPFMLALALQASAQADISGKWQYTNGSGPNTTWAFDLQVSGNKVTGTVSQTGGKEESAPIYFGSIEGNSLSFKVTSPDGDRIITFIGKITPVDIGFQRVVEVRPGGSRGDVNVFGDKALLNFTATRPGAGRGGGGAAPGGGAGRGARGGARGQ